MENEKRETQKQNIASFALMKKRIIIKGTLLIATLALLVVLAIVGTVGWYTKVSSVDALTMDVAQFDFTANYVDEIFVVNTAEYTNIQDFKVAPGSGGVIPILLKAENSDVPVEYTLKIDTADTAPEMQRRIRYYYYPSSDNSPNPKQITIQPGAESIKGKISAGGSVTEYIYWEWVYELSPDMFFYDNQWHSPDDTNPITLTSVITKLESFSGESSTNYLQIAQDDFDELDTQIGLGNLDERFVSYVDGVNRTGTEERPAGRKAANEYKIYTSELTTLTAISGGAVKQVTMTAIQKAMQATINIKGVQGKPTDAAIQNSDYYPATRFLNKDE